MRTLIVYFSRFGNTRRLAETMAETMKSAGEARVASIDQLAASDVQGVDLVVMGTPTHAFAVPAAVRKILQSLPSGILNGKSVAAFDTTVKPWPLRHLRAAPKLLKRLIRLGGKPVARPETFFVATKNPQKAGEVDLLLEGELDRGRQWAGEVVDSSKTSAKN
jgi:flavodoxin